ncbi:MAG TPA: dihydropteroate synthase, partial [Verrucomicrobiae bacterium]|nr:dihydropteroate synthase [Verrucomicrobiae bacterium]
GASIINDVGASREDADLWRIVADSGAGYVCMHMQGNPETMQDNPVYVDAVKEVERFFELKLERMSGCGVRRDQIILDPGIGFGKKIEHNLELLGSLREFAHLARPLLLGVSRKSFLGRVGGGQPDQRLAAGLACACWALAAGIQIIRTHDVLETVEAVRMTEALAARQRE